MDLKNTIIFGDSYSTFKGHIPEGYAAYYSNNAKALGITSVKDTWWHQLFAESNTKLIRNDSWSGSTVCYTGYNGDCSETSSFICRLEKLIAEGFFKDNQIDTVLIFGATNDAWVPSPVGELKYSDWEKEDLYKVLPAVCYFINRVKEVASNSEITWIINDGIGEEIPKGIKEACKHYGIRYIQTEGADKISNHPTRVGMMQIKDQIAQGLKGEKITTNSVKEEYTFSFSKEDFEMIYKFIAGNLYKSNIYLFIIAAMLTCSVCFNDNHPVIKILISAFALCVVIISFINIQKKKKQLYADKDRIITNVYTYRIFDHIMSINIKGEKEEKLFCIRFDELKRKKDLGKLYVFDNTKNLFFFKKSELNETSLLHSLFNIKG